MQKEMENMTANILIHIRLISVQFSGATLSILKACHYKWGNCKKGIGLNFHCTFKKKGMFCHRN